MRLGSIKFINSLPVDLGLMTGAVPVGAEIVRGTPVELNQKILAKDLDASAVSVFWYAKHQKELLLFPDLSISSESGVQSVLLFSRCPFPELKGRKIAVTDKGRTTPALLEILCRQRYGFVPNFEVKKILPNGIPEGCEAELLIGNDALESRERLKNSGFFIFDLAEEWRVWTGLPFVFAVWVARKDSFAAAPEKILSLHESLLRSKKWGLEHGEEVVREAAARTVLPEPALRSYFDHLSYELDEELKKGMRKYFEWANCCGLLGSVENFEEIGRRVPATKALAGRLPLGQAVS